MEKNKVDEIEEVSVAELLSDDGPEFVTWSRASLRVVVTRLLLAGAAAQKEADLATATKALLQHRDVEGFENLPNDLKCLLNRIANTTLKAIKQAEIGDKHV